MSDSARASILPSDYRIPYRCESALHLAFLVRDLCLARLCLSSHILFGIECIATKSGHAVDRLDRPPLAFEGLFAFLRTEVQNTRKRYVNENAMDVKEKTLAKPKSIDETKTN